MARCCGPSRAPTSPPHPKLTPPQEYEARLYRALLPTITRADVEAAAGALRLESSAVFKTVEHRWAWGSRV